MKKLTIKIVHFLVFSCPEATLYIEKQLSGEISSFHKFRLNGHLAVCKWCRFYSQKSHLIHRSLHNVVHIKSETISTHIVDKTELLAKVEKKLKKNRF